MAVRLEIDSRTVELPAGQTVFEGAERAGVRVPTSCHKNGKCRECLVEVLEGMELLSPRSPEERHLEGAFRLACRARVEGAGGRVRCQTLRRGAMRIEEEGTVARGAAAPLDPAVRRDGDWVLLDGRPVERSRGPILGVAADVGTTTVVLRLVDLETGANLGSRAFENPQRFGGSDVMARIHYDTLHPGRLLQRTLLGYLGHAIEDFGVDPRAIYEIVVAGNSTLRDLLFGISVRSIGQRPYRSLVEEEWEAGRRWTTSLEAPARKLRLPAHPAARVYGLPLVRRHVGADAAACLLAVDWAREDRLVGLMDIGTNTELLVGGRGRLLAASCPAGPAFEGGLISCGMPGLDGAIEAVRIEADGSVSCQVIGGGEPRGICGSGLVAVLGELLRTGRMNGLGRLADESSRFHVDRARGISLTEADLSQLAQAKGANVAGLAIVLKQAGLGLDDLEVFYLAGGFARHLDIDAARRIGLIPDLPDERFLRIGNASIEGAAIALLSVSRRRELEELVKTAVHVELEQDEGFFDAFVDGCLFAPARGPRGRAAREEEEEEQEAARGS
ncbi:MAG: DUF4445 domain-containing protein [Planctomycetes bacterium]|nr:DUF4445 domain-containing protein [Planctomycetota bacterium]